jgi:hypothetical protein
LRIKDKAQVKRVDKTSGGRMNNLELQKKAEKFVTEKKWDDLLIEAFIELQHYPSWSKRNDFESKLNIGVMNVGVERKQLDTEIINDYVDFCVCEFTNLKFKIGGKRKFISLPDGDFSIYQAVELYLDDRRVLSLLYYAKNDDPILATDFKLITVAELHNDVRIEKLLTELSKAIKTKFAKLKADAIEIHNNKLKDKFTF